MVGIPRPTKYEGTFNAIQTIWREEGARAFGKGVGKKKNFFFGDLFLNEGCTENDRNSYI
jgi:hypothetical protein